jgi:uncharacterized phage-like protein YoqJ
MIISCTGHRPPAIGGYNLPNPTYVSICQQIQKILLELKPAKLISGMAQGFDQYAANVALKLNISLTAAIPCDNQDKLWSEKAKRQYAKLLSQASEIVNVSTGPYSAEKMLIRNKYLVDNCDVLLACFNGDTKSGTYNCINYATKINRQITYIKI